MLPTPGKCSVIDNCEQCLFFGCHFQKDSCKGNATVKPATLDIKYLIQTGLQCNAIHSGSMPQMCDKMMNFDIPSASDGWKMANDAGLPDMAKQHFGFGRRL